jgi:hypothetical protein
MLMKLGGFRTYRDLQAAFELRNLSPHPVNTTTKAFRAELQSAADAFVLEIGHRYILVGYEVVRAFGSRAYPLGGRHAIAPLVWYAASTWCAYLPHPSGRNRWYNSRQNRIRVSAFLTSARDWRDDVL